MKLPLLNLFKSELSADFYDSFCQQILLVCCSGPRFEFRVIFLLDVWPRVTYSVLWALSSLICKMGILLHNSKVDGRLKGKNASYVCSKYDGFSVSI